MEFEQHTAQCKTAEILEFYALQILEWQVVNEKMNSNSMRNMYKLNNNTSVLIQES